MNVLVTGATGFIGSYVVDELLRHGVDIIATSRNGKKALKMPWFEKVKYIEHDLESEDDILNKIDVPDLVIHLAWNGLPNYFDFMHFEKNLPNSYSFLKNLIESGLKDVVVLGTCFEYGLKSGSLNEEELTEPVTVYGLAKDTLRKFIEALKVKYNFDFKWIRLFYLYSKNQSKKSLISQLEVAVKNKETVFNMSGGEQLRDYLPVEKVAEYIVRIALQKKVNGIINCCSGKPVSVRKFVEDYLKEIKSEIKLNLGYYPYPDYEPFAFWGDNSKLIRAIGL